MKSCPKCGKNEFYVFESTVWSAEFDEQGVLHCTDGDAGGIDKVVCICGESIDPDTLGEVNFN